jgi:hypothetical protein
MSEKTTQPGMAIGGGVVFLLFGLWALIDGIADPTGRSKGGMPVFVFVGVFFACGIAMIVIGLRSRRRRR